MEAGDRGVAGMISVLAVIGWVVILCYAYRAWKRGALRKSK